MANFKYVEFITTSNDLLTDLKAQITGFAAYPHNASAGETAIDNEWEVVEEVNDTTSGKIKSLTLGTTASIGSTPVTKEFHVKLAHPGFGDGTNRLHSTLIVQTLEGYHEPGGTYDNSGHPVTYEWADKDYKDGANYTDRSMDKPIYVYLNVMNSRIAMVLVGDPAVHFNDYRKSFLYVGAIKPFTYNDTDADGNILITAGAEVAEPVTPASGYDQGQYTSFGNNTFQMFKTKSGIKYQKHYPAFITQAPTPGKAYVDTPLGDTGLLLEQQGFNASAWTRKYHLSPIYIIHPYDGYRGQLEYCIAVSKNNILHLDDLIVDIPEGTPGKTWTQEVYRYFDHNTKQNFMNRSANVKMGVAMLKEVRY
ncbi:MAG: hypothetical protein J7559_12275 [Cohnella sp.]|nr:hypothetical protein [Cohnella sp.]